MLVGQLVTVRPGTLNDLGPLLDVRTHDAVTRWWGPPDPPEVMIHELIGGDPDGGDTVLLVLEVNGEVAGGIQYSEEPDPQYRHAGIDIFVGAPWQGRGVGTEAVWLVARFLFDDRGHHRLTIDPSVENEPAVRTYLAVGFQPVGIMRRYEQGPDGSWHDGLLLDLLPEDLAPWPDPTRHRARRTGA
jgi:aminoglycoside 6'-N-acetyltransferase